MKILPKAEKFRVKEGPNGTPPGGPLGLFVFVPKPGVMVRVVASPSVLLVSRYHRWSDDDPKGHPGGWDAPAPGDLAEVLSHFTLEGRQCQEDLTQIGGRPARRFACDAWDRHF